MDDQELVNKKFVKETKGRSARENKKDYLKDEKLYKTDSKGSEIIKRKRKIDRVNEKAFAIQNVNKFKKKVAYSIEKQTKKHTFKRASTFAADAPRLITIFGDKDSGKSTLFRSFMRLYLNKCFTCDGPITITTSKTQRIMLYECPNDLVSYLNAAKVTDFAIVMVNADKGFSMSDMELASIFNAHGMARIHLVFTHLDKFKGKETIGHKKMKEMHKYFCNIAGADCSKVHIQPFRTESRSEYKLDQVRVLARTMTTKSLIPNEWRKKHSNIIVDRIETIGEIDEYYDKVKMYGYVRDCNMRTANVNLHLDGIGDMIGEIIKPIDDPCPCMLQETQNKNVKSSFYKQKKGYSPFNGIGGVLKDDTGYHIVGMKSTAVEEEERDEEQTDLMNCINDESNEDEEDEDSDDVDLDEKIGSDDEDDESEMEVDDDDEPPMKKQRSEMLRNFESLEGIFNASKDNKYKSYADLIKDGDNLSDYDDEHNKKVDEEDFRNVFVTGDWGAQDAESVLKEDDVLRQKIAKKKLKKLSNNGFSDDENENDDDDDIEDEDDDDDLEDEENDDDLEDEEEDDDLEDEEDDGSDSEEDLEGIDDGEMEEVDEDSEENSNEEEDVNVNREGEDWKDEYDNLSEFKKKKLERLSMTKREKKAEKRAKKKQMFEEFRDKAQGGKDATVHFEDWKELEEEKEKRVKNLTEQLKNSDEKHDVLGIKPGTYVCVTLQKSPKIFQEKFRKSKLQILGCLNDTETDEVFHEASFKIHTYYSDYKVMISYDPICLSIGWRRIQVLAVYYKISDDKRNLYLKYSNNKYTSCNMGYYGVASEVGTSYVAFMNFDKSPNFRIVGSGNVKNLSNDVRIEKKLKLVGEPAKILGKTAFIKGMFKTTEQVMDFHGARLQTVSKIRGAVKQPCLKNNRHGLPEGCFRATFEAPITMSDIVFVVTWQRMNLIKEYQDIVGEYLDNFVLWIRWNDYKRQKGISNTQSSEDSKYKPKESIVRKELAPAKLKLNQKLIKQLPFKDRPNEVTVDDIVQKSRVQPFKTEYQRKIDEFIERSMKKIIKKKENKEIQRKEHMEKRKKEIKYVDSKKEEKKKGIQKQFYKRLGKRKEGPKGKSGKR